MGAEVLFADALVGGAAEAVATDVVAESVIGDVVGGELASGAMDTMAFEDIGSVIDSSANAIDAVDSVSEITGDLSTDISTDIPIDMSTDIPVEAPFDTSLPDIPINEGGLPPIDEGSMGPPTPEDLPNEPGSLESLEQIDQPNPEPTDPYNPNGMPDETPPDPTKMPKMPKMPKQILSKVAKLFMPKPTQSKTRGLGTSKESALGSSATGNSSTGANMSTCNFLCSQANFLTDTSGPSYKGGLEKLQQLSIPTQSYAKPYCVYSMQDQMNVMGQSPVGVGLGYASGGIAHLSDGAQPEKSTAHPYRESLDNWKQAFCEKNWKPEWACDKPELMRYQSSGAKHESSPLKQIKSGISGGYAHGGLPEKYHAAAPEGHNPEFITGMTGYYACGGGTGQSDDIPAMLHDGDYVMDAETVSALGDGSSKAGRHVLDGFRTQVPHKADGGSNPVPAKIADGEYVFPAAFVTALGQGDNKRGAEILDGLRTKLRAHKRGAPLNKIPPKAKNPIDYIKKGKA